MKFEYEEKSLVKNIVAFIDECGNLFVRDGFDNEIVIMMEPCGIVSIQDELDWKCRLPHAERTFVKGDKITITF